MTTNRLAVLVSFLAFGLGTVFLLPKSYEQPTGIRVELPEFVGNWKGTDSELSEYERTTLGEKSGTQFARKLYRNLDGYEILVSIVLSGRDMSTAIHRPERCLQAQGWNLQESEAFSILLPQRGEFPAMQLRSTRLIRSGEEAAMRELQTIYWFVGERSVTGSHWSRWAIDNRDRMLRGVNQRWAYILVSSAVPVPQDPKRLPEARKWSQNVLREFITMLAPKIHLDSVRYE
jgi:EpsI family protein